MPPINQHSARTDYTLALRSRPGFRGILGRLGCELTSPRYCKNKGGARRRQSPSREVLTQLVPCAFTVSEPRYSQPILTVNIAKDAIWAVYCLYLWHMSEEKHTWIDHRGGLPRRNSGTNSAQKSCLFGLMKSFLQLLI